MARDTTTVSLDLPTDVHDALAAEDAPARVLERLAEKEARMLAAIERYADGSPPTADDEGGPDFRRVGEHPPPIAVLFGAETVAVEPGRAVVAFEAGPRYANPMGTLHGGVICDLGDAAMGTAYATTLAPEETFTTLALDVTFLKPVWDGRLTATGELVKGGRTIGLVECEVRDDDGALVAQLQSRCLTLRGDQADGR